MGKVVHVAAHNEVVKGKTIHHRAYFYTRKGGLGQAKRKPKRRAKAKRKAAKG